MCGWFSAEAARASRSKRSRCSSDAASAAERSFSATSRCSLRARAWYTSPMLPAPRGPAISKRSAMRVPGGRSKGCALAYVGRRDAGERAACRVTFETRGLYRKGRPAGRRSVPWRLHRRRHLRDAAIGTTGRRCPRQARDSQVLLRSDSCYGRADVGTATGRARMRSIGVIGFTAALLAGSAAPARAEGFITPYLGFNFGGDSANCISISNCEEKRINWGVTFGSTSGIFGIQEDIGYAPEFFGKTPGASNGVLHLMTDFMLVVPAGPIQPYAFAGIGLIRSHAKFDTSSLSLDKNAFGYDIGGGLNIFFVHSVGIHGEIRHLQTFQDLDLGVFKGEKLDFWRASAGLTFRF